MASSKAVWGIDLGQCALKAVKLHFDAKEDVAVAEAFDYIEHPKILSQPDAEPDELIRAALEKFLSRNDVEGCEVNIAVPGQAGLARFVKLPPVEQKKIPDIVQFEAKQQIPFPLEDVAWDYQKIGGGEAEEGGYALETEVGIFAIKRETVLRQLQPYMAMGIDVSTVQLSPVALYNFAAYEYFYQSRKKAAGEAKEGAESEGEEGGGHAEEGDAVVLLDMGADKTDVVITDGDSIWQRNLPIGGNHFTRALTKDFKLTFAKAEHLKRNATKAPDPKKLYQAMRPVFQDFASELQRSIGFYLNTHRHQTIKRILGVGNGFKLPGLQKFLGQNLQYEVVRLAQFRGLKGEEVVTAPAFVENHLGFCTAYGLALQGLGQTPIQTNLLPREIQIKRLINAKKPWSLAAATAVLLGCVFLFYGNWRIYSAVHAKTFEGPEAAAKAAVAEFQRWDGDYKQALAAFENEKRAGATLVGLDKLGKRLGWIRVLKIINDTIPPRSANADDAELYELKEINVEFLSAEYSPNLADWFNKFEPSVRDTMAEVDKQAPPAGAGWIFRMLGYTFNDREFEGGQIFVQNEVLRKFQTEALRKEGISHAVVSRLSENEEWTPASRDQLREWAGMASTGAAGGPVRGAVAGSRPSSGLAAATAAAAPDAEAAAGWAAFGQKMGNTFGGSGQPAPAAAPQPNSAAMAEHLSKMRGGGMDVSRLQIQVGTMREDMLNYSRSSTQRALEGGDEESYLKRTDFEFQFVWIPKEPTAEEIIAELSAVSEPAPAAPAAPSVQPAVSAAGSPPPAAGAAPATKPMDAAPAKPAEPRVPPAAADGAAPPATKG